MTQSGRSMFENSLGGILRSSEVNIMRDRHIIRTIFVLAFLACIPTFSYSSSNKLTSEEASRAVEELVQTVGPAYECLIWGTAIREVHPANEESGYYHVSFDAFGPRCDEALKALNYRGKSKGLWFFRTPKPERIDKVPEEPNLDLIHEIDPPVDT